MNIARFEYCTTASRPPRSPLIATGYDEAAGTEKASSGFTGSVPALRLSASGRSKRHFWGGTRGKEPNTDNLYNETMRQLIPPR
ncbi:hypothetical protein [Rhodococcus qingshengii]|uniref:hypothetical protein n=1 Tax=Rhodococcus qingshengii TaxID=334542 RepID=UPI0035DA6AE0